MTVIIKITPVTYTCVEHVNSAASNSKWSVVQQEINSILNLGYKLYTLPDILNKSSGSYNSLNYVTWYFAIP